MLDILLLFPDDRLSGHQYHRDRLLQPALIQAKRLSDQATGSVPYHSSAESTSGDDSNAKVGIGRQRDPVGYQTAFGKTNPLFADAGKLSPGSDPNGPGPSGTILREGHRRAR